MTVLETLAEWTVALELSTVPPAVLEQTKRCLLDFLGAAIAGARSSSGRGAAAVMAGLRGEGPCTVIGRPARLPADAAAFVNGIAGHALEVDDAHRYATGYHPGVTVIPAALAVAEAEGRDAGDLLLAIVAGYEVGGRIGAAMNPSHRRRGFHSTGTIGPLGAAAAAARLLRLDAAKTVHALGIAASSGGGIFEFLTNGATVKHLHAGGAARNGVIDAMMAARGFTGPLSAIEGEAGFFRAYADDYDVAAVTKDLGSRFEVDRVYFKPHAACGHSFPAVDAALALRTRPGFALDAVERVDVRTYHAAAVLDSTTPTTPQEARFSIPYCVAAALALGHAQESAFDLETIRSPRLQTLTRRVRVADDAQANADFPRLRTAVVSVALAGGEPVTVRVDFPRGTPENPLSETELVEKFDRLTTLLVKADAEAIRAVVATPGHGSRADFERLLELLRR